jgi:enolase
LRGGGCGVAAVPSGASRGNHEAVELRDGGERYGGLGVRSAVSNLERVLAPAVLGLDALDQRSVDAALVGCDDTEQLARVGANAVLAVSIASLIAAADAERLPLHALFAAGRPPRLPLPMVNVLSGGAHAGGLVDVQDFLVVPMGAGTFAEAIEWAHRVRAGTAAVATDERMNAALVADEGGLAFPLPSNRSALELLARGIERSGLTLGEDCGIAVDVAATQLFDGRAYRLATERRVLRAAELVDELESWRSDFPIVSIEDPLADDDWDGWRLAGERLGDVQLVADDLFATSAGRLQRGISQGIANAVLVKPNQAGTVSRAADVVALARRAGYAIIVSARSGDTEDSWLADLAVGWSADQIKVGSTMRSERTAKWNRLLDLEAKLGGDVRYAGKAALDRRTPSHLR